MSLIYSWLLRVSRLSPWFYVRVHVKLVMFRNPFITKLTIKAYGFLSIKKKSFDYMYKQKNTLKMHFFLFNRWSLLRKRELTRLWYTWCPVSLLQSNGPDPPNCICKYEHEIYNTLLLVVNFFKLVFYDICKNWT